MLECHRGAADEACGQHSVDVTIYRNFRYRFPYTELAHEKRDFEEALEALGERSPPGTEIYLAGGAALIFRGDIDRATDDGDVIDANLDLDQIRSMVAAVGEALHVGADWLNEQAAAFLDVLPAGYRKRADHYSTFGNLTVHVLSRRDLMLLKLYAHRAGDVRDLEKMTPTGEEVDWILDHLEGAANMNPHKIPKMRATLRHLDPRSKGGRRQ